MKELKITDYIPHDGDIIVDVRSESLYKLGTISGAINIPIENIKLLYSLPNDKDIYVFCQVGDISGEVVELLTDAGYNATNLMGGYREYMRHILSQGETNGKR